MLYTCIFSNKFDLNQTTCVSHNQTRLERLARDQTLQLITKISKLRTKKFYNIGPSHLRDWIFVLQLFSLSQQNESYLSLHYLLILYHCISKCTGTGQVHCCTKIHYHFILYCSVRNCTGKLENWQDCQNRSVQNGNNDLLLLNLNNVIKSH